MNVINTIDLAQELQARTSLSQQDASGIVQTIAKAIDATTSNLVTREQFDARFAEMEARLAELKADVLGQIGRLETKIGQFDAKFGQLDAKFDVKIAELRAEFHQAIRGQTAWMAGVIIAVAGLALAIAKLT
jgi:formyltetrahydrofolate hydrolase